MKTWKQIIVVMVISLLITAAPLAKKMKRKSQSSAAADFAWPRKNPSLRADRDDGKYRASLAK